MTHFSCLLIIFARRGKKNWSSYLLFKHVDMIQLENIAKTLFSPSVYENLVLIIGNMADRLGSQINHSIEVSCS